MTISKAWISNRRQTRAAVTVGLGAAAEEVEDCFAELETMMNDELVEVRLLEDADTEDTVVLDVC